MKNYRFIKHVGTTSPVANDTLVVYRTTSTATPTSHVHLPIKASLINWGNDELYMGRIKEWALDIPMFFEDETVILFDGSK